MIPDRLAPPPVSSATNTETNDTMSPRELLTANVRLHSNSSERQHHTALASPSQSVDLIRDLSSPPMASSSRGHSSTTVPPSSRPSSIPTLAKAETHVTKNHPKADFAAGKIPDNSDLKQQRLRAWQPVLTPRWIVIVLCGLGIFFIPIGAALLYASSTVHQESFRYDTVCGNPTGETCSFSFNMSHDMSPPIYFYYKLSNYYQNHRRYVSSQSVYQLHGNNNPSDQSSCRPGEWEYYSGHGFQQTIYPCGVIAGSFFNDTFTTSVIPIGGGSFTPVALGSPQSAYASQSWDASTIAYPGDLSTKYQINLDTLANLALPLNESRFSRIGPLGFVLPLPNNSDFAVWQRVAALPTFKKLYRVIRCVPAPPATSCSDTSGKLHAGDVIQVQVANNFNINPFSGQKWVVISTVSMLGGKNYFLGAAWVVVGGLCFLLALVFGIKTLIDPPQLDQSVFSARAGRVVLIKGREAVSGEQDRE